MFWVFISLFSFSTTTTTGGPGCGKGTNCDRLVKEYGFIHYSAGDLLRAEAALGTEEGKLIATCIKEAKIVPGHITIRLLKKVFQIQ